MKNQILSNGKKLNNRQLRSITGGLINCLTCPSIDPPCPVLNEYGCITISKSCGQVNCRPL